MTKPHGAPSGPAAQPSRQSPIPAIRPHANPVGPALTPGPAPAAPGNGSTTLPPRPQPVTAAPPAPAGRSGGGAPPIRFGLCGAPSGGKTTFLASLSIAVAAADEREVGRWSMTPADDPSLTFLIERERELISGQRFPQATQQDVQYQWQIDGKLSAPPSRGWLRRQPREPEPVSFSLEVEDRPGGDFLLDTSSGVPISDAGLDRLAGAEALIFLFDPMRELARTDKDMANWQFFSKLLHTLKMRLRATNRLVNGRLPHHVAVCVTKFDDPAVFVPAYNARLVDVGEDAVPRVPADRAEDYFSWICAHIDPQSAHTDQFRNLLRSNLLDDHVRYFATSAVGFWTGPDGRFNPQDFQNAHRIDDEWRLRGRIRPVNVLEPLIAIERKIRLGAW
jgi:hypothetical protein